MSQSTVTSREVKRAAKVIDATRPKDVRPAPPIEVGQKVICDRAAQVIARIAEVKSLTKQLDESKDWLRGRLDGIVARAGRENGEAVTSVEIPSEAGRLRVTYADAYKSIKLEKTPEIQRIIGDEQFGRFFGLKTSLKIKSAAIKEDADLTRVVNELATALGEDRFEELFDVSIGLQPTTAFTVNRYAELTSAQLKELEASGVEQTVAFSVVKEN